MDDSEPSKKRAQAMRPYKNGPWPRLTLILSTGKVKYLTDT
jgi:hypothetical protein